MGPGVRRGDTRKNEKGAGLATRPCCRAVERDGGRVYSPEASLAAEASHLWPATMPAFLADGLFDLGGNGRILLEEGLGVLAALADALAVVGEPGAGLLDDTGGGTEIDQFAGLGDALAVHDVEFDDAERRRHLVLHHLHPRLVADDGVALLDRADAAGGQGGPG